MNKLLLSILINFAFFNYITAQESVSYIDVTPTISHMVPASEKLANSKKVVIKPNFKGRELYESDNSQTHNLDWVWQQHENLEKSTTASLLWQVTGVGTNMSPPDPSLDADSTIVLEATNSSGGAVYRIFNKNTGAIVASSLTMQTLGGPAGYGDPIVLYYKPAKRWFLTEFASSGNKLLLHVSQTSNPQGAYYTYQFTTSNFPDYPKWSFCPTSDALLVSTNEGGAPRVYAMKLSSLLAGTTSPFFGVATGYTLNGFGFQSITPVDIEGDSPAPTGMKPLFIRHRDDESHTNGSPDSGTNDWLELWEMTINWTNNSATVAKIQDIAIAEIDSKLCGLTSFTCVPQPGTTIKLDPLRETVMFKAPMRVFSTHQALVVCLATDVNGNDRAGVRWCELRRASGSTSANWTLHQEGTYSPGTTNRWMPAINMDKNGNIIMAYSTSSNTSGDFPSIKMTGRKACDPLGQMTMPETTIISGGSSKTSDTRWGDYHHMSIDHFDGLTFYYAGVYRDANSTRTNVSAVKMDPDATDASIVGVYQVVPGQICGSSVQLGVIVQNNGTNPISSGSFTWQIGTGSTTTVNYNSTQLNSVGSTDTIIITISGLASGSNTLNFASTGVNSSAPDDNTCNDAYTFSVTTGGNLLNVTYTINTAPSCTGSNGQITFSVTGGASPYSFSINGGGGQPNGVFNGLAAGTINYSITDNTGCAGTGSFALNPTTTIVVNSPNTSNILCAGQNNGSVQLNASGGVAAYTYSSNGTTYQSSNTFNSLSAGTYTFYAKDANGCIGTVSVTITEPSELGTNAIPTAITCFGLANGMITISATGGTPGYTYSLNGGSSSTSNVFSNLSAGSYAVNVQDANGCISTFNTTVVEPTQISASAVPTGSTGANGTITITGTGGNAPYTYSINGVNFYSGTLFSNLAPGTYTCYVKDVNGCITSVQVVVDQVEGIDDQDGFEISLLYPNPNKGTFELEINGVTGDEVECKLFNIDGKLISVFVLGAVNGTVKNTIEMSHKLAAGSYYLGVYNDQKAEVLQFIKE